MNALRRLLASIVIGAAATGAYAAPGFTLTSPVLDNGGHIPMSAVYTQCGGGNQSPRLLWHDPPAGTKSYAVTMFDPDAAGGFWHWIIINIPSGAHGLNVGAGTPRGGDAPGDAVQLRNDFGNAGYSGPCPPAGKPHHYVLTVHALDVATLGITAHLSRKAALDAIKRHSLASATLVGLWGR